MCTGKDDNFTAMDVAADNRVMFSYGSEINFMSSDNKDSIVTGILSSKPELDSIF